MTPPPDKQRPVNQRMDKQLILDSLAAIARGAGRAPSRSEFASLSGISEHQVAQFFPTWNDAVRAAGLRPNTLNVRLEDRELLEDWGHAVRRNHKTPTRRVYRHLGKYDHRTFERRFGPWSQLPEVFRNFAQDKPEWADVVALLPVPLPSLPRLPRTVRGASTGATKTCPVYPELSSQRLRVSARVKDRLTYGNPIDFRGLRHEPVNEQGVVLLFGLVAKELGYIVEAVQSGFPDCEAKRQIARNAGSACTSSLNLKAGISAITDILIPVATSSSAGATIGPTALSKSKSSSSPP